MQMQRLTSVHSLATGRFLATSLLCGALLLGVPALGEAQVPGATPPGAAAAAVAPAPGAVAQPAASPPAEAPGQPLAPTAAGQPAAPTAAGQLPASPAAQPAAGELDGVALLQEVDRRLQPASYEAYRKLINIEPSGRTKEFVFYTAKKGIDKVVGLFLSPASEKGRATLRLGENMWLFIPNVGKPMRITSLQSVTGGVFNNSDILQVDYTAEYDVANVERSPQSLKLSLKAKNSSVAYDRLLMTVDPTTLQPSTIECYAASGLLIKTLHFSKPQDFGGGLVRPSVIETDSPLQKGYKSVMVFAKLQAREFSDEVFTLNYLPRVQELR